ncbi:hypothetical protein ACN20G_05070 [Streptomyces sp. BI20]|uniref:hypothetical protein n=1 Tax=Streptomyces sp. BI20 TaxID=3403460 RepID=UPI003C7957BC
MTVFLCARCGTPLTPDLRELPVLPEPEEDPRDRDADTAAAPAAVARGAYAVDPEPWAGPAWLTADRAPTGGAPVPAPGRAPGRVPEDPDAADAPAGTIVLHPADAPALTLAPGRASQGCCGPRGDSGRNLLCPCGARPATLVADCLGPRELRLDPYRIHPVRAENLI